MEQISPDKIANKAGLPKEGREGKLTRDIENVTGRIPSGSYLSMALGSMAVSAALAIFTRKKTLANFVGLWVPTIMLVGIYNKIVKVEGSDRFGKKPAPEELH